MLLPKSSFWPYILRKFDFCFSKRDLGGIKYWCFARNTLSESKCKIYTPKRDDEHLRLFIWKSPPPAGGVLHALTLLNRQMFYKNVQTISLRFMESNQTTATANVNVKLPKITAIFAF